MFIQSKVARSFSLGTTDADYVWSLPTNPLDHILIKMNCLTAAANVVDDPLALLAQLLSVQVRFRGSQIVAASGADIARLCSAMGAHVPRLWNPAVADNSPRSIGLIIPFGRKLFDGKECFPASAKGELELYLSWDAVTSSYDNITLDITTLELPDANPTQFIRYTTMGDTPSATGVKDYDLPRIAPVCGYGIFQTASYPDNATPTINSVKTLVNNIDYGFTDIDPISLREYFSINRTPPMALDTWTQQENSAGGYTQYAESIVNHTLNGPARDFMYLNFDPNMDGQHVIPGPAATEVKARIDFAATSAIRIIPVELYTPQMLPSRSRTR